MQFKKRPESISVPNTQLTARDQWYPCDSYVDNAAQKKAIHKIQQKENIENFLCLIQIEKAKKNEKTHQFPTWQISPLQKKKKNFQLDKQLCH